MEHNSAKSVKFKKKIEVSSIYIQLYYRYGYIALHLGLYRNVLTKVCFNLF